MIVNVRRITASMTLAALLLGTSAVPALAERGEHGSDKGKGHRVSEKFEDMDDFRWGLDEVTKMTVKGVFQGRGQGLFAPGAKITHEEAAVAMLRLMDKEADAKALAAADVEALLAGIPDQGKIDTWARPAVAVLVKVGALDRDSAFAPLADATRLDVAVLMVNALGYKAEADAKMTVDLPFKDDHLIPAELVGYVAVAVDHKLIAGYEDRTFRPQQAVKRIEMAVMLGRADRLIDHEKRDEYKGTIKSVDAAHDSFVLTVGDKAVTLTLADEASIFIDSAEKELADLTVGMKVEVKLNSDGKVIYIEAKTEATTPDPATTGKITALKAATATSLALVTINNTAYPLSPRAEITVNDEAAAYADLKVGDAVKATINLGLIVKLEVQRSATTVTGSVVSVTAATQTAVAKISVKSGTATTDYPVAASAVVKINGQAAELADLRATDTAALTFSAGLVSKIDITRAAVSVSGKFVSATEATDTAAAKVTLTVGNTNKVYPLAAAAAIKLDGQDALLADLLAGDQVTLAIGSGIVDKVEATRPQPQLTVIEGSLVSVVPAAAGQNLPAGAQGTVSIGYTANGGFTMKTFVVGAGAQLFVNGQQTVFADLLPGDAVKASLQGDTLVKLEVTR